MGRRRARPTELVTPPAVNANQLMPAAADRILGVVLCGGRSARMGHDKADLPHPAGGTFLQHALGRMEQASHQVVISGGDHDIAGVTTIPDSVDHQGPVVGIAESLAYARQRRFAACLFTPVDVPSLTVDDLGQLCDHWRNERGLAVAHSDRVEPLIGIYPVELADDLGQLARSEDRSLQRWIRSQHHTPLPFPADRLRNINTPEDLR